MSSVDTVCMLRCYSLPLPGSPGSEGGQGAEMSTSSAWFGDDETTKNKAKVRFFKGQMHWEMAEVSGLLPLSF